MKRDIIEINEEKCTGCGQCVPNCHEGALQIIDGKVRLVSELMCDGLGACIGHCPEDAIRVINREAEPYDEVKVISEMVSKGLNTVTAHLRHLRDHKEHGYLKEAIDWLRDNEAVSGIKTDEVIKSLAHTTEVRVAHMHHEGSSCPGSRERAIAAPVTEQVTGDIASELRHWPVQMHLINPASPAYRNADLLLSADCVAYSLGAFHNTFLRGKSLAIACPKLDTGTETYIEKLVTMIDVARVNTITVMIMEVPCCSGLIKMVNIARQKASRKVPVKVIMVSIDGKILSEEWN